MVISFQTSSMVFWVLLGGGEKEGEEEVEEEEGESNVESLPLDVDDDGGDDAANI